MNLIYDNEISGSHYVRPARTMKRVLTYCGTVMIDGGHAERGGVVFLSVAYLFYTVPCHDDWQWPCILWGFDMDFPFPFKRGLI